MKEYKGKYCLIFDNDNTIESAAYGDNIEDLKDIMKQIYEEWICDEVFKWELDDDWIPHPTEKQIEDYDYMIDNCTCWIAEWNDELKEYYDEDMNYIFLSNEECDDINWLYFNELKKKFRW